MPNVSNVVNNMPEITVFEKGSRFAQVNVDKLGTNRILETSSSWICFAILHFSFSEDDMGRKRQFSGYFFSHQESFTAAVYIKDQIAKKNRLQLTVVRHFVKV